MESDYICKNPELSNIEVFKEFSRDKFIDKIILCSVYAFSGLILFLYGIFCRSVNIGDYNIYLPIVTMLIFLLSLIYLFLLFDYLYNNLYHESNNKFILCPLICSVVCLSVNIILNNITIGINNLLYPIESISFEFIGLIIGSIFMISFGLESIYDIIVRKSYAISKIQNYYEYNSELPHTGIICAISKNRLFNSFPEKEGLKILAKKLFNNKLESFRVYFCFTKEDVTNVIKNENVLNLWIFGHGTKGSVGVTDGSLYYCDLDLSNIPNKGYIHQMHCNGLNKINKNTPLVELLVNPENRKDSTDTGDKHNKDSRNQRLNKKTINEYIKKIEEKI